MGDQPARELHPTRWCLSPSAGASPRMRLPAAATETPFLGTRGFRETSKRAGYGSATYRSHFAPGFSADL